MSPEQWTELAKFFRALLIVVTGANKASVRWTDVMRDRPADNGIAQALSDHFKQDAEGRRTVLAQLVEAGQNTAFALKELTMMNKHRDAITVELHRQTHNKLEEVTAHQKTYTENQERIIKLVRDFTEEQRRAA